MPVGDILPEIAILLAAITALLVAAFSPRRHQWVCAVIAFGGVASAFALCWAQTGTSRLTFSGVWALDGASIWARLIISGATGFVILLSPDWMKSDRRHGEYYAILLFSCLGAMALEGAADLLQLIMGALLSSVSGYTLAAYHRDWAISVEAGMKYFLVGALANTVLAAGATLMLGLLGDTDFTVMKGALATGVPSPLLMVATAFVVIGLAFKLGAVPAHFWVPDVAEGAPVPAAAFLTVVPKIGAAVALARFVGLFPSDASSIRLLIAAISVATMTLGNLAALWQQDLRRLIGWSSVSQSGYALMAVAVAGVAAHAPAALLFFLLGYTVANLAAFAVVAHLRGRTAIQQFQGLGRSRPVPALVLVIALLSLTGIPPLVGFIGKLEVFVVAIDGGYAWLAAIAVANTVVSLFYYLRVIGPIYFGAPERAVATLGTWTMVAVVGGGAALLAFGLAAEFALDAFANARLLP